ncbi:hypothetical protein ACFQV4_34215 [Streptomyces thermocarboxydus]
MPCADEHDGEVFALVTVPGTDFPGDDSLTELSEDRCYERQSAYVMDGWSLPEEIGVYYFALRGELELRRPLRHLCARAGGRDPLQRVAAQ